MENSKNILARISENNAAIKSLEEAADAMPWSKRTEPEAVALYEKADALKIENAILKDNARRAYVAEITPAIKAAFGRFNGKKYGEKTAEKINAELAKTAGCRVYISRFSSLKNDLCIIPMGADGYTSRAWGSDDFTLHVTYNNGEYSPEIVNKENTINAGAVDGLHLSGCAPYVENVTEAAQNIINARRKVQEAKAAAEEAANYYNSLIPSKIKRVYFRSN